VDASGAAYVTGYTYSTDFPTENPYQTYQGGTDVFVTKLSSSGDALLYSTYLGGGNWDWGRAIAIDAAGAAYVTGRTYSTDFPTENPYQTYQGYYDVFVTKLSSSGSSLLYSTYLGGNNDDGGWGIAVDASGAAYVTGKTYSTDFPTLNPYQTDPDQGYKDVFVTKIADDGTSVDEIYSPTLLDGFILSQNYPNPFNPQTQFEFSLPHASHVKVEVFNVLGQRVTTLVDKRLPAGSYRVTWDGKDYVGQEVSSGVYLYRLTADEFVQSRKMLLLK